VKFEIDLRKGAWRGTGIAPGVSGAVVGADAGEDGDTRLHQCPVKGKVPKPILDHNYGISLSGTVHVQPVSAEIDHFAWRLRCVAVRVSCAAQERANEHDSFSRHGILSLVTGGIRRR